jgi:release factor glutamine methyltransferase
VSAASDRARTWRDLLADAADHLESPAEARRLVEEVSGLGPAELVVGLDDPPTALAAARLAAMCKRRADGEPLQYVLGHWTFRTLDLLVDRRVLIPRPETEVVAGIAIREASRLAETVGRRLTLADLGTGSGAIALTLAAEVRNAQVWATDSSPDALAVAEANLAGLGGFAATRVRLLEGHWYDALPSSLRGQIDLLASNPPYVAVDEALPPEVSEWEPPSSLRAGTTGLECLHEVVAGAPAWLATPGVLVVELAPHQARAVQEMATAAGFDEVAVETDLAGRDRVVVARR